MRGWHPHHPDARPRGGLDRGHAGRECLAGGFDVVELARDDIGRAVHVRIDGAFQQCGRLDQTARIAARPLRLTDVPAWSEIRRCCCALGFVAATLPAAFAQGQSGEAKQPAYAVPNTVAVYAESEDVEEDINGVHVVRHLQQLPVGDLTLTSGAIVAIDGFVQYLAQAFVRHVTPGRYPVILTTADSQPGSRRVAFARVQFRPGVPAAWEMATLPGQELSKLASDEVFGYPVDSGTGAFMDMDVARAFERDPDTFGDGLQREFDASLQRHELWASLVVDPRSGGNVVIFASGFGDGVYASYWGLDQNGQVLSLVTDFGVLDDVPL